MEPLDKLTALFISPAEKFYCFNHRMLLTKSDRELHAEIGCNVDDHSQAHYEEIEQAAGVLS